MLIFYIWIRGMMLGKKPSTVSSGSFGILLLVLLLAVFLECGLGHSKPPFTVYCAVMTVENKNPVHYKYS